MMPRGPDRSIVPEAPMRVDPALVERLHARSRRVIRIVLIMLSLGCGTWLLACALLPAKALSPATWLLWGGAQFLAVMGTAAVYAFLMNRTVDPLVDAVHAGKAL